MATLGPRCQSGLALKAQLVSEEIRMLVFLFFGQGDFQIDFCSRLLRSLQVTFVHFFFSLFFKLRWIPKDILGFTRLPRIPQVLARTTGVSRIQRTRRETAPYELQGCGFSVEPDSYWLVCSGGGFRGIPGQRQVSFKFPCILYRTLLQLCSAGEPAACLSDEGEWDV